MLTCQDHELHVLPSCLHLLNFWGCHGHLFDPNCVFEVVSVSSGFDLIICVFYAYFQERKSLQESIKKISENLTKLREEINRTQRHLLKNVSFVGPIEAMFSSS